MAMPVGDILKEPADKFGNDAMVEMQWAMKAFHHAETYFNLLCAIDPVNLKLTPMDEDIHKQFKEEFKDMKVDVFTEDDLKNEDSKKKWREFCMRFENQVEDYHMGTLLRLNCYEDVSEKNTTLVPRIQFLAIEISRNRQGFNSGLRDKHKPKPVSDDADADKQDKEESS